MLCWESPMKRRRLFYGRTKQKKRNEDGIQPAILSMNMVRKNIQMNGEEIKA
ncbi:hypothetical protein [Metabacillus sp. FJAT-53654]|uniref:Transposase n=1 Tax=Metabacillus rhizosphaerae TaxID=3117747 RepID=A0ABZ2MNR9_9BACI